MIFTLRFKTKIGTALMRCGLHSSCVFKRHAIDKNTIPLWIGIYSSSKLLVSGTLGFAEQRKFVSLPENGHLEDRCAQFGR